MKAYQQTYRMPPALTHPPQQHPKQYAGFTLRPSSGALGAEIADLNVTSMDAAVFAELEKALADHLVLFIRDQNLDAPALEAFARRFGKLTQYPTAEPMPGHPEITEFRSDPDTVFNFGGSWHTDSMFLECPPKYTILHNQECPAVGGDTSYANLYLAWDTLSEELRGELDSVMAVNSSALSFLGIANRAETVKTTVKYKAVDSPDWNIENAHPIARTHPVTGRKALYVSDCYTAKFVGKTQEESLPILRQLFEHVKSPDFTCRFKWQVDTLAIWDNRCCIHYAHNDYAGQVRVMRRVIVEGERPV